MLGCEEGGTFLRCTAFRHVPASALTDNGVRLHLTIHSRPQRLRASAGQSGHRPEPQTLADPRPRPTDINQLQTLLDTFRQRYNTAGPHRALPHGPTHNRPTPHCPKTPPPPPPRTSSASAMTRSTNSANSRCATAADYTTSARAVGAAKPVDHQRGPPRGASPRRRESRRAGNSAGFGAPATDRARRGTQG
jgi:hypothetical protein